MLPNSPDEALRVLAVVHAFLNLTLKPRPRDAA